MSVISVSCYVIITITTRPSYENVSIESAQYLEYLRSEFIVDPCYNSSAQ